jgi:dihydroorotate dehydrogenase (NAD+) catalytic subunit
MEPVLKVNVAGLEISNPTMLAAGVLGISHSSLERVYQAGAGAVVTKSIGINPRKGYPNPTIVHLGFSLLNAMGLPNSGIDEYCKEVILAKEHGVKVVASIFGSLPSDFQTLASTMESSGADAIELNLSCPHVKGVGMQIGHDPEFIHTIVSAVKSVVKIPVFTKLTPNVTNIVDIAKAAENAGVDAITAINTVRAMAIDIETGRPLLANKIGGLSGQAIQPIALRCVYEISKSVDVPVIGVGGILNWRDAVAFLLAGASAIQLGTAIAIRGLNVFHEINEGLKKYMSKKGYKNVNEFIGFSHKY